MQGCSPVLQVFSVCKWPANILYSSSWTHDPSARYCHRHAIAQLSSKVGSDRRHIVGSLFCPHSDGGKIWDINCIVQGDVLISCTHLGGKDKNRLIFRFSFHTAFIAQGRLTLAATDLDGVKPKFAYGSHTALHTLSASRVTY
jgi:hypothetical protein